MSYLDPGGKSGAMEGDRCNRKAVYKPYCDRFHHKLIQQLWNNSSRPLGLVVKRITSMTYKSANDKIARSIRAEGIQLVSQLFKTLKKVIGRALWRSGYRASLESLFLRERRFESCRRRFFALCEALFP